MSGIPLFLLEEHNEAFLAWNYSVMNGWLPAEENTLLHVDEHSDLELPAPDTPIRKAVARLEDLIAFTYSELSIASFVYPAVFLGLFRRIFWLRQRHDPGAMPEVLCVTSDPGGRRLRRSATLSLEEALDPDRKCFRLSPVTAADSIDCSAGSVVLDIDLDCFSCDNGSGEAWEVEITRSAYEAIRRDRYHPLRLAAGNLIKVREQEGSYYICSNYGALTEADLRVDERAVSDRIDALMEFLRRNSVRPAIIDIARSRISGYTPPDQWEFIETKLLAGLSSLYECEPIPITRVSGL